jgi:hypothetical protein
MTGPGTPPDISDDDDEATQAEFNADVLRRIREAGGVTESLIAVDLPQIDRYGAYMQGAQDHLAKERYFDAEERFISAMTARPGDINAAVGRAHAQLGAGLFLSAGLNLRQLLVAHPEIAGMRYGKGLLPSPERIESIRGQLEESLDSPTAGTDSGLLLAYLGFQTENEDDIRAGLGAMEQLGDEADVRLAVMLRGVWLEQPAAPQEAAPDADGGEGG